MAARALLKRVLGSLPLTAEAAQSLRSPDQPAIPDYRLDRLAQALPGWCAAARDVRRTARPGKPKRLLVLGYLPWWLEYASALGLVLASQGHEVELAFLPYRNWQDGVEPFDLRRHRLYLKRALEPARPLLPLRDLSDGKPTGMPDDLAQAVMAQSKIDVQYTAQREAVELGDGGRDHGLYRLRLARNQATAAAAYRLFAGRAYDAVVIPNGSILEFGAVYLAARHLGVPTVTYEFGERRERMWVAHDSEVMRLDASALWEARGSTPLADEERESLRALYQARRAGVAWSNFERRWQAGESQGARSARQTLGIDPQRPMALLCTNVVGDSLALGRQVFTSGMADWLTQTVRNFAERPGAQLVVRVHPGELLGAGHPSVEIVRSEMPQLPSHVIVVPPESKINTYDLIELAHLGLVYTTTVGLEMAMSGVPVVVAGQTHYRGKGFTVDPETLPEYRAAVGRLLDRPIGQPLEASQVELATRYAYRFFFEFAFPFPWHLVTFWEDIAARPLEEMIQPAALGRYARTLRALAGEPIEWGRGPSVDG